MTAIRTTSRQKLVRVLVAALFALGSSTAVAAPGGGKAGGKGGGKSAGKSAPAAHQPTRTSVSGGNQAKGGAGGANRPAPGGGTASKNTNVKNTNVNNNVNVNNTNVNVNVNQNVNVRGNGGYYGPPGGYYGPPGGYYGGPSAVGVVAGAVATAIVVGAVVASLPPNCTDIIANGVVYHNCGGTYYQPQYAGSNVTYVVVNAP